MELTANILQEQTSPQQFRVLAEEYILHLKDVYTLSLARIQQAFHKYAHILRNNAPLAEGYRALTLELEPSIIDLDSIYNKFTLGEPLSDIMLEKLIRGFQEAFGTLEKKIILLVLKVMLTLKLKGIRSISISQIADEKNKDIKINGIQFIMLAYLYFTPSSTSQHPESKELVALLKQAYSTSSSTKALNFFVDDLKEYEKSVYTKVVQFKGMEKLALQVARRKKQKLVAGR